MEAERIAKAKEASDAKRRDLIDSQREQLGLLGTKRSSTLMTGEAGVRPSVLLNSGKTEVLG
jgi:hypothetical protein